MNHRKMPSLSEMERIEQSLLGEKLDEMLDRIEKEDVAYVITEDGKDKLVLCPYRWFEENFPDDVGCVVNSAIRQELTAESENADAVRQFICQSPESVWIHEIVGFYVLINLFVSGAGANLSLG